MSEMDLLALDPGEVRKLFELDALIDEYGESAMPALGPAWHWRTEWTSPSTVQVAVPLELKRCDFSDNELASFVRDVRSAIRLPFSDEFLEWLRFARDLAEREAHRRLTGPGRRRPATQRHPTWQEADLAAEVAAVCGPGRQRGRELYFSCHWHEDRTPSLHVDPENRLWHCFSCQRGGGVVAWRRAIESAT